MNAANKKDLVVLVADVNMEQTVRGLLDRPQSLGIRRGITFDVFIHPRRDPGVFHEAHEFLRSLQCKYEYALVMLDREGSGQEHRSAQEIGDGIQQRLNDAGWSGRSAVVVLDPELEAWVFSNSPHVVNVIANGDQHLFRDILQQCKRNALGKPQRPKEVMEEILREKRIPRSSALCKELATRVGLSRCADPAFNQFKSTLQKWFSP